MAKCKCGNTKDKNGNCDGSHKKANTEINWINNSKTQRIQKHATP